MNLSFETRLVRDKLKELFLPRIFVKNGIVSHPPSLRIFFATEMWERYGFYVIQSLLTLYLAFHFHWQDKSIYTLVGTFTALTYLSPLIGGWIADHLLGQKKAIILGALFLLLSFCSLIFIRSDKALIASLANIAIGTGLLKPNISSLLGNQYPVDSPQREGGFTIFYMGITTGIILGTFLPSLMNEYWGWPASFFSAAIGIVIALTVFIYGIYRYKIADYHPIVLEPYSVLLAFFLLLAMYVLFTMTLYNEKLAIFVFSFIVLFSFGYLVYASIREPEQARYTVIIGLLCLISVAFWTFYFQMFLSLTLFITRLVDPKIMGVPFPPPYYVGVQSIGMLIFGYFLARKKRELNFSQNAMQTGNKFFFAMLFMTLAYSLITVLSNIYTGVTLLSPLYLLPAYLMISIAELLLSPVGLSAITLLANRKRVSTMTGIFFVSLGTGGFLAGELAKLTSVDPTALSLRELSLHYASSFTQLLIILVITSLTCLILNRFIALLLKNTQ